MQEDAEADFGSCGATQVFGDKAVGDIAILEIQDLLARWRRAFQQGDIETIGSLLAEDAEFWTHGAAPVTGRESVVEVLPPLFGSYRVEQRFECHELLLSTDLAVMRGVEHNVLHPLEGGDPVERQQRAVSILRRDEDGQWRFARGITNLPPDP